MHNRCPDPELIEEVLQGHFASPEDQSAWDQHLTECAACRNQLSIAKQLSEDLGVVPIPELSTGFEQRLMRRLHSEQDLRSAIRFRQRIMLAYWIGAAVLSCLILGQLEWSPYLSSVQGLFGLTVLLVSVSAAILFLTRQFRMGLADLLISTVDSRY